MFIHRREPTEPSLPLARIRAGSSSFGGGMGRRTGEGGSGVNLREEMQEALARIVFAREAVELGENQLAAAILRNLEHDVAAALAQAAEEAAS
jgi:hypothetical protein